jgi:hypothetical protein
MLRNGLWKGLNYFLGNVWALNNVQAAIEALETRRWPVAAMASNNDAFPLLQQSIKQ